MKRKLWIYGRSYSDFWGYDETMRKTHAWPRLVAKDLNLSLTNWEDVDYSYDYDNLVILDRDDTVSDDITWRHEAGRGFTKHQYIIFEDILKWQPQDIVIIGESVRQRAFNPNLSIHDEDMLNEDILPFTNELIDNPIGNRTLLEYSPNKNSTPRKINNMSLYRSLTSWKQWYTIIPYILTQRPTNTFVWHFSGEDIESNVHIDTEKQTMRYLRGGNWTLPHWKEYTEKFKENLLLFPNGDNYQKWMYSNMDLMYDWKEADDHQSLLAHKEMAKGFARQIKARMK